MAKGNLVNWVLGARDWRLGAGGWGMETGASSLFQLARSPDYCPMTTYLPGPVSLMYPFSWRRKSSIVSLTTERPDCWRISSACTSFSVQQNLYTIYSSRVKDSLPGFSGFSSCFSHPYSERTSLKEVQQIAPLRIS